MSPAHILLAGWTWGGAGLPAGAAAIAAYLLLFGLGRRFGYFAAAVGLALAAFMSPVGALADGYLFSAHMLQHIVLLLVVPALVLLGLPRSLSLRVRPLAAGHPLVAWIAGVGAMWVWHAPALCNAAVSSSLVHGLQTISLLLLGCAFWRPILAPRESERLSPPAAILYLFAACAACSVLGIILTLSPVTVCSVYAAPVDRLGILQGLRSGWGMTPERDQQIGGLLMWVPMCFVYLAAIVAQIARWFAGSGSPSAQHA